MAKNSMYVGVIILEIIALILGYFVYKQLSSTSTPSPQAAQSSSCRSVYTKEYQSQPNKSAQTTRISSSDWDKIVRYDSTKATEEQTIDFNEIVRSKSTDTNTLQFNRCKSSPLIVRLKKGSNFIITSTDSDQQVIVLGHCEYTLNPGESITLKTDFAQVAGIYRYPCRRASYYPIAGVLQLSD